NLFAYTLTRQLLPSAPIQIVEIRYRTKGTTDLGGSPMRIPKLIALTVVASLVASCGMFKKKKGDDDDDNSEDAIAAGSDIQFGTEYHLTGTLQEDNTRSS